MSTVHLVVPDSFEDLARPSGGNTYDRRVCAGLGALGWSVRVHAVPGRWPHPRGADRVALAGELEALPPDALVLVDGLVASCTPEVLVPATKRLRVVVLVHLPLGHPLAPEAGREMVGETAGAAGEAAGAAAGVGAAVGAAAGVGAGVGAASGAVGDGRPSPAESERMVLESAVAVVTTSEWTRQWLVDRYDLVPDRLHVSPPGADRAQPTIGTPAGGELLCVAAVVPAKGHVELLAALASVSDLPWRLVCAGALDLAPDHVARLRSQCQGSGLADRVTFAGPLAGDELDGAYAAADLLVLGSKIETYGLVVTEALARAVPVIARSVGGVAEAMTGPPAALGGSGHADHPAHPDASDAADAPAARLPGLLVPQTGPDELGLALRSWLEDAGLRERLRAAARARRETLSPWSLTAQRIAEVLARVAA